MDNAVKVLLLSRVHAVEVVEGHRPMVNMPVEIRHNTRVLVAAPPARSTLPAGPQLLDTRPEHPIVVVGSLTVENCHTAFRCGGECEGWGVADQFHWVFSDPSLY